MKKTTLHITHL